MHDILFQDRFDVVQMAMCFNAGIIFAEYVYLRPDDAVMFEFIFDGSDRIRGIGYGVGLNEAMALRFELVRKR